MQDAVDPKTPRSFDLPTPVELAAGWLTVLVIWAIEESLDFQGPLAAFVAIAGGFAPLVLVRRLRARGTVPGQPMGGARNAAQ
ncbi:hypothetical protein OHA25_60180 (plasmid) [Nonomuraea sp. NBC_00507]|uniref:hypothetical protein n=1 Tax=Nonomuraea sp. NBC_00507 TaxID=2976002 RepID=UPI002E185003